MNLPQSTPRIGKLFRLRQLVAYVCLVLVCLVLVSALVLLGACQSQDQSTTPSGDHSSILEQDTTPAQGNDKQPEVNPQPAGDNDGEEQGTEEHTDVVNPDDSGNGDNHGIVIPGDNDNNNENGNQNGNNENQNENGENNNGENGSQGENGNENGENNNGENGNQGGDNGEINNPDNPNPDDPEINPDNPNPDNPEINPDDPNPDDPEINPQPLDFSALEAKLVNVVNSVSMFKVSSSDQIIYSKDSSNFYIIADTRYRSSNRVSIYKMNYIQEVETQNDLDNLTEALNKDELIEIRSIIKSSSDISVDGTTYSKDGIEGDNPFARQCGVENAWMTYVSDVGRETFAGTDTGYGRLVNVLTIKEHNEEIKVVLKEFCIESYSNYSSEDFYRNLITEGKNYLANENSLILGKNLKEINNNNNNSTELSQNK